MSRCTLSRICRQRRQEDLEIIAIPAREDSRDVLVGRRLDDLSSGTRVGTGAPRRAMQLLDWAAGRDLELDVVPMRGNVETRIERVREGQVDAVILAAAGLRRLGLLPELEALTGVTIKQLPAQILDHQVMLPAPGQGALALEIHRSQHCFETGWHFSTTWLREQNPLWSGVFSVHWRPVAQHRWGPVRLSQASVVQVSI